MGIDDEEIYLWYEDYIDSANNNVSTDCNIPDLEWFMDFSILAPFMECGDFELVFQVSDQCDPSNLVNIPAMVSFEDTSDPAFLEVIEPVTNIECENHQTAFDMWFSDITSTWNYQNDCSDMPDNITITHDCNSCSVVCGGSITVNVTATEHCGNSASFTFTLNIAEEIIITDNDFDGFDDDIDNCPTVYNPGQEDIDMDGIGNSCDTENAVGELTEVESNLYLSAPYTGLILTSENGSCYVLIVNNDGSLSTLPVTCP